MQNFPIFCPKCKQAHLIDVKDLQNRSVIPHNRKGATAFAVFLLSFFVSRQDKPASGVGCRSPPASLNFTSKKFRLEVKDVAYNHGREKRKWRLWKEAEEKILREYGISERIIEEIRISNN